MNEIPPKPSGWRSGPVKLALGTEKLATSRAVLTLISGARYVVTEIMLCNGEQIGKAISLKAQGSQKMAGWSSGIGFWGSFDWVVMGSAVVGAVENAVNKGMATEGVGLLSQSESLFRAARRDGKYFSVNRIMNLQYGIPALWQSIDSSKYIHNGDPFIHVKTEDGHELAVAWDKIEQFWLEA